MRVLKGSWSAEFIPQQVVGAMTFKRTFGAVGADGVLRIKIRAPSELRSFDAIGRDEGGVFFLWQREAGWGDLLACFLLLGAGVVEGQEVGEDVLVLPYATEKSAEVADKMRKF